MINPLLDSSEYALMPRLVSELPQSYENITRPVALDVARQLAKMFNLPKNIRVILPGAAETTLYPGTALPTDQPMDSATFGHNERLVLEILENPVEDRILTTAVHQVENIPFFLDEDLGVRMYPVYSGTEMNFTFTYRAANRTQAVRFRNEMLARTAAMREVITHEIQYYYHVPYVFLHLLKHLYTLREAVAGYGETWDQYVSKYITERATTITDQIGQNQALAVRELQTAVFGNFQYTGTIEQPEKDKESGTFNCQFQYKFTYDQVISAVAEWPLLVHNQLVSEPWRSQPWASGDLVDPARRKQVSSLSRYVFNKIVNLFPSPCETRLLDGITIPNFDEWRPSYVIPNTSSLIVAMVALDPTAPQTLFELMGDLDGYQIDPSLKDFLIGEAPYLNSKGGSVFDLRLYQGDDPMDDGLLSVSAPDLIVVSNAVMDLRKTYHVRLALVNDLFTLAPLAWERLRNGGEASVKILNCLQQKLLGKRFEPKLLGGYLISQADLVMIAQRINDLKVPHKGPLEHVMLTVNDVVVVTQRSNDNGTGQQYPNGTQTPGSDSGTDPFTEPADCSC